MAQVAGRLPNGIRDFDNPHRYNDPDYVREIAGKTLTDDQLVGVYVNHPMLIRTPVVVTEEWATAGEPEEQLARRLGVPV